MMRQILLKKATKTAIGDYITRIWTISTLPESQQPVTGRPSQENTGRRRNPGGKGGKEERRKERDERPEPPSRVALSSVFWQAVTGREAQLGLRGKRKPEPEDGVERGRCGWR